MEKQKSIIVLAEEVETARTLAACDPRGIGMFVVGLSLTGQEPATHYISAGKLSEEGLASYFPHQEWELDVNEETGESSWVTAKERYRGDAQGLYDTLNTRLEEGQEMPVTAARIQSLFDASDVTNQDGKEAKERLGLKFVAAEQ